ncbi:MAG: 30S ribosomal protein S16 [Gammaproteobacteria bacterium]|nr:30S ribosomal protein S16 [Gammaproteobacteria bacterium]
MVTIRLSRGGAKKKPFYHIDVKDSRTSRDGRYIERLGFFNPGATGGEQRLAIDMDRITYWTSVGAQTSDRVSSLIKQAKAESDQQAA